MTTQNNPPTPNTDQSEQNVQNEQNEQHKNHQSPDSNQGFSSMDPEKQREIASQGGKAAHEKGSAHEWDADEASEAGSKGGAQSHTEKEQTSDK